MSGGRRYRPPGGGKPEVRNPCAEWRRRLVWRLAGAELGASYDAQVGCSGLGLHGRAVGPKLHFLVGEQTVNPEISIGAPQ